MGRRDFAPHVEETAKVWRATPISADSWSPVTVLGKPSGGSQGFWVTNGQLTALAKPNNPQVIAQCPGIAAHEKIASDLAYDLELPVPPVVLWDRGTSTTAGQVRYVAVSAVPFDGPHQWAEAQRDQVLRGKICASMRALASAMCAFDTWLGQTDHNDHDGNLIFSPSESDQFRVAYLDYGNSLSFQWKTAAQWDTDFSHPLYHGSMTPDWAVIDETVSSIRSLSEEQIRTLVTRIPAEYIDSGTLAVIADGLLLRRHKLEAIIQRRYPKA